MLTQALKNAIIAALQRLLPGLEANVIGDSLIDNGTLLPMCRIIEYNESVPVNAQTEEDWLLLFGKAHAIPEALSEYRDKANSAMNNYIGYRTAFRECNPNAASIFRIALGLHMTIDEINSILLSYDLQTVSWHRVSDILLRYAVSRSWSYGEFMKALTAYYEYREEKTAAVPPSSEQKEAMPGNSSYMTQMNIARFYSLSLSEDEDKETVYKKLHALFFSGERSSSGAPRRTFLRTVRLTQKAMYHPAYSDSDSDVGNDDQSGLFAAKYRRKKFSPCPGGKVQAAYYLMHEAAGIAPASTLPENAQDILDNLINAIDDVLYCRNPQSTYSIPEPNDKWSAEEKCNYREKVFQARCRHALTPSTLADSMSCDIILRTVSRDFPQNAEFKPYADLSPEQRRIHQIVDLADHVQSSLSTAPIAQSGRSSLFRLLLCCGSGTARNMLNQIIEDVLFCTGTTVLSHALTDTEPAAQAAVLAKELGYTQEQLDCLSRCFEIMTSRDTKNNTVGAAGIKAFIRNVLQPQYVTKRYIKDQLSAILDILDPKRRNSEPSRPFLILLALYTYGFVLPGDLRGFSPTQVRKYVQNCLSDAWDTTFLNNPDEDIQLKAAHQLIDCAYNQFNRMAHISMPPQKKWLYALSHTANTQLTQERIKQIALIESAVSKYDASSEANPEAATSHLIKKIRTITYSNPLIGVKLVSGGWEY